MPFGPPPLPALPPLPATGDHQADALALLRQVAPGKAIEELRLELARLDQSASPYLSRLREVDAASLGGLLRTHIPYLVSVERRRQKYLTRMRALGGQAPDVTEGVHTVVRKAILANRPDSPDAAREILSTEAKRLSAVEDRLKVAIDNAANCHHPRFIQDDWLKAASSALADRDKALKAACVGIDPLLLCIQVLASLTDERTSL